MLSKTTNSRSLHSDGVYLLYLLRCLVYHMLFKTRRNSGSLHRVIGEVLVLGLLVVVHKIPYSSCIFNTAVVVLEPTMVCAYHTAVYLVHRSCLCHIYSWFLLMMWTLDLSILLSICRAYIYILLYVRLVMPSYLLFCCIYFNAGCITCCPNEKKLWKFTQSDR